MNGIVNKTKQWVRKQIAKSYVWWYSKVIWYLYPTERLTQMKKAFDISKIMVQLSDEEPYYRFLFYKLFAVNLAVLAITYPEHYDILRQKYDWLP